MQCRQLSNCSLTMQCRQLSNCSLTMQCRQLSNCFPYANLVASMFVGYRQLTAAASHNTEELDNGPLPEEWYKKTYTKLIKLNHTLSNIEQIDGRLTNISDYSVVTDGRIISQMQAFNSLAKAFIGYPSMQRSLQKEVASASETIRVTCFSKPSERNSMRLSTLTAVCNFLDISAQQRRSVRLAVCPQVTQHHIWQDTLQEVLRNLKTEMDAIKSHSHAFQMSEQIVFNCIKVLADTKNPPYSDSTSWMRLEPLKKGDDLLSTRKWEEVLEMFVDLAKSLEEEERLACHVSKLEAMKEGLYQIQDVWIESDINYREVKRQESLIQKKLSKTLGHSSKCLFTLLLYYLCGSVTDIEVEVCGGKYETKGRVCVYIGKILTSCNEEMIQNGVRQLSRALGVFKFVRETAAMDGVLELQGHIWCMGAEERILIYRGNKFFVHGMRL